MGDTPRTVALGGGSVYVANQGSQDLTPKPAADTVMRLTTPLMEQIGVDFLPFAPALTSVTGTVTGNTFIGFNAGHAIFNNHDWAGIAVRDNTIEP